MTLSISEYRLTDAEIDAAVDESLVEEGDEHSIGLFDVINDLEHPYTDYDEVTGEFKFSKSAWTWFYSEDTSGDVPENQWAV